MGVKYNFQLRLSQPWKEVEAVFACNPDAFGRLMARVPERDPSVQLETMTVKSLLELSAGGFPSELADKANACTVREYAMLLNTLRDGMARFMEFLRKTKPPVTAYEKQMSVGTLKGNIEEAILWTLRESFGLQSLEQAHNLTIYEYMVARKSVYNDAVVAYNRKMDMAMRSSAAGQ